MKILTNLILLFSVIFFCSCGKEDKPKLTMVTEATFPVTDDCGYFRITVMDAQGRCADTNAYFVDELI